MLYVTRAEPTRSVEVCLQYLERDGIHFSAHPSRQDGRRRARAHVEGARQPLHRNLALLPEATDAATLATLDVLAAVASPAWFSDQLLPALVAARMANISIERGHSSASSFAYAMLGTKMGPFCGDYRTGYRFGKLASSWRTQRQPPHPARVLFTYTLFVRPWADHLDGCRELLNRGFEPRSAQGSVLEGPQARHPCSLQCPCVRPLADRAPLQRQEPACRT